MTRTIHQLQKAENVHDIKFQLLFILDLRYLPKSPKPKDYFFLIGGSNLQDPNRPSAQEGKKTLFGSNFRT